MTIFHALQRLFALVSLAVVGLSAWLLWSWWDYERDLAAYGIEADDTRLFWGLGLLALSLVGRTPVLMLLARGGDDAPRMKRDGEVLKAPDGLRVESYGEPFAPALIFTHGWGLDSTIWAEAKRQLGERFRIIVWDLPGLGRSRPPAGGHITVDGYAAELRKVLALCEGRPAVLVGHSIGGMIVQSFCRRYPQMLGREVAGVVLENTTHLNPLHTTLLARLLTAIRWPVIEPAMRLDIWLSPLVRLLNWQSFLSGATHIAVRLAGFGTRPTRGQLDQVALLATRNSPAVQAKGNLAMMRWGVTEDLPRMRVPALVFIGDRDLVTRPEAGETIAADLPQGRRLRIDSAGHMGPVECSKIYNDAIARFADEVLTQTGVWADRAPRDAPPPGLQVIEADWPENRAIPINHDRQ